MRQINAGDSAWALVRCEGLKAVMQSACATGFKVPDGFYTITAREGVAMLVEPVNADPFVFVAPGTIFAFESTPGSGTDGIRQRILATHFYDRAVECAGDKAVRKDVATPVAEAANDPYSPQDVVRFERQRG